MKNIFFDQNGPLLILFLLAIILCSCSPNKPNYPGPLSPKASIKTFHFADDFKAKLFAAEPFVKDPVAMRFDERGNAYVIEMGSANLADSVKGKGRIVRLRDTDGDGQVDQSTVFAGGLTEPTSILPWKDGLIVTAAPNILYLKDADGDGHTDSREVLFSGFSTNGEEHQITSLRFSVNNWIYANNNGQVGKISSHREPKKSKISVRGADFRFRLDRNEFELASGQAQFGQAFDDWGHRFITKNTQHIQQVIIPGRYLRRNPYLPSSAKLVVENINDHGLRMYQLTPAPYWRKERTRRRNKKYQEHDLDRVEYAKDHFTGASGGTFYGGDRFLKKFYGSIFTGDVAGNLVHRDVLARVNNEPFFVAKRGKSEHRKEFMAATDPWFRPVNFTVGPAGYLYVIDMYRQHIEGPDFIPKDLKTDMDFSNGDQRGRIYRIMPGSGAYKKRSLNLRDMKSHDLVNLLAYSNRWQRLRAHMLLVERQDKTVIPAVKALFSRSKDPKARLQALYVLEGLNALNTDIVEHAMEDPSPGVRENAAALAERFPECLSQLEQMIADSSMQVAFQATLSVGEYNDETVGPTLAKALKRHGESRWFRTAVLSSKAGSSVSLLEALTEVSFFQKKAPWKPTFFKNFSFVIARRNEQVISFLDRISVPPISQNKKWQLASLEGVTSGLEKSKKSSPALKKSLQTIQAEPNRNIKKAIQNIRQLYAKSSKK